MFLLLLIGQIWFSLSSLCLFLSSKWAHGVTIWRLLLEYSKISPHSLPKLEEHRFYEPKVKIFFSFTFSPFSSISQTKEQDFLPTPFLRSQNPKKKDNAEKKTTQGRYFPLFRDERDSMGEWLWENFPSRRTKHVLSKREKVNGNFELKSKLITSILNTNC